MTTARKGPLTIYTRYLRAALFDFEKIVKKARATKWVAEWPDTFVGTGLSGALVVPELARRLGKHFMLVRAKGNNSHSRSRVEGALGRRWVLVDDLVHTGDTVRRARRVIDAVAKKHRRTTKYGGLFLYGI